MAKGRDPVVKRDFNSVKPQELQGKTAIVTGAGRGIGRAIAIALAQQGAELAIGARTVSELESVQKEIEKLASKCVCYQLDVRRESSVDGFLTFAADRLGPVDILVNNAGIYKTAAVSGHSLEMWREVMEINLTSALLTSRGVIDGMVERNWGRIVNISSISGKVAEAFGAAYSASKFGMIGLTQALALEVARHQITVNAICPGWVDTQLAGNQLSDEKYLELTEQDPSQSQEIARLSVPQMRFIEPDEVAGLVVYLCSESARGITGQAINVCGGMSLH